MTKNEFYDWLWEVFEDTLGEMSPTRDVELSSVNRDFYIGLDGYEFKLTIEELGKIDS